MDTYQSRLYCIIYKKIKENGDGRDFWLGKTAECCWTGGHRDDEATVTRWRDNLVLSSSSTKLSEERTHRKMTGKAQVSANNNENDYTHIMNMLACNQ